MRTSRDCPFCGSEDVDVITVGDKNEDGILMAVACQVCNASILPVRCSPTSCEKAVLEWQNGVIRMSYIKRIKKDD